MIVKLEIVVMTPWTEWKCKNTCHGIQLLVSYCTYHITVLVILKHQPGLNYCVPVGTFTVNIYCCVGDQLPHSCNHSIMLLGQKFQF